MSQTTAGWLDSFFRAYFRRRPVNATFIGAHEHDDQLPDLSEEGTGDALAEMEALLQDLRHSRAVAEPLSAVEALDLKLAEGFLEIQIWEATCGHFWPANPSLYTGEAIFGVMSLFLSDSAPLAQRVESAVARLKAIPHFLAQAQRAVRQAPLAWTEKAIQECTGALAFLQDGLDLLGGQLPFPSMNLRAAADAAAAAFAGWQQYLEGELRSRPKEQIACGEAGFDLLMQRGHFLDPASARGDETVRYAEAEMAKSEAYLAEHAADWGATDWRAVLPRLADIHPTIDGYYQRYAELWAACRATAEEQELLTWPEFPIRYVPRPAWSRAAAPYLYFLYYRSPAAFNRPPVHDYLVTPIEPTLPVAEQERLLRAHNDSVIKLNHVVHHGAIGHHVQNWHAYHAASRIGQIAAVDCACRLAMFCAGTMAEGWACYATYLMGEAGFLTPLELYAEHQTRLRMGARAVVDVRLHQGRMTLEQAAGYYTQRAGMSLEAARSEAVRNSMYPGAAMMYLIGNDRILQLRQEMARRWGSRFSLRRFHDQFLSYGSIPVALIATEMGEESSDA